MQRTPSDQGVVHKRVSHGVAAANATAPLSLARTLTSLEVRRVESALPSTPALPGGGSIGGDLDAHGHHAVVDVNSPPLQYTGSSPTLAPMPPALSPVGPVAVPEVASRAWAAVHARWDAVAASPQRAFLGYGLALLGALLGGAAFPLMDCYSEPELVKVAARNVLIAAALAWRVGGAEAWGASREAGVVPLVVACGVCHAAVSVLNQAALGLSGVETAAVLTNCSCVFAVVASALRGDALPTRGERWGVASVVVVVLYLVAVVRPPVLGVVLGLLSSCLNAAFYVGQRSARARLPLLPLLTGVYAVSACACVGVGAALHPEYFPLYWFSAVFNVAWLLPTVLLSALTFGFQGSLVLALRYCTPVVVTGAMSLEPLATLLIDVSIGRPLPDTHTLCILLLLMASTTVISLSSAGRPAAATSRKV